MAKINYETLVKIVYDSKEEMEQDAAMNKEQALFVSKQDLTAWYAGAPSGHGQTCEDCPWPRQLPPHIKTNITLEMKYEDPVDILEIIQNGEEYFPGFHYYSYALAQSQNEVASGILVMMNHDIEEDDALDENEDEDLEDIFA